MNLDLEIIYAHPLQGLKNVMIPWEGRDQGGYHIWDKKGRGPENVVVISEDLGQGIELEVDIVRVLKIFRHEADVTESLDQGRGNICPEGQGRENLHCEGQDLETL